MADDPLPEPFDSSDPFALFARWLAAAETSEPVNPNAMCLATSDRDGRLSTRMVLLKAHGSDGLIFYTNLDSRKGQALAETPQASACFYWRSLGRQINIEGGVVPVAEEMADDYFASRPRASQIGAWASHQSRPLNGRDELLERFGKFSERFGDDDVPRPPNWSGLRIVPTRIEFWLGRDDRLHDRLAFTKTGESWDSQWLNP